MAESNFDVWRFLRSSRKCFRSKLMETTQLNDELLTQTPRRLKKTFQILFTGKQKLTLKLFVCFLSTKPPTFQRFPKNFIHLILILKKLPSRFKFRDKLYALDGKFYTHQNLSLNFFESINHSRREMILPLPVFSGPEPVSKEAYKNYVVYSLYSFRKQ